MIMNKYLNTSIALLLSAVALNASVTLQIRTQLANAAGTPTTGMSWGVLVDTAGDGFAVTPTGTIAPGFDFSTNGALGGDNYFVGSALTVTSPPFGGTGVALNTNPFDLTGGVEALDLFGIFWTDGTAYGFVTAGGATLPSDGGTVAYNTVFTDDPYTAGGSIVPEPSTYAALAGMLALGYVMVRRRRA
jgi:hypothetical protein